jgi:uncharacterized protein (DUF1697 family)
MAIYVALLRGINVGGRHSVKMADLRAQFLEAGAADVTTYIQSGNVVFRHSARPSALTRHLEAHLTAAAGFEVPVTLRTAEELATVVAGAPFPTTEPTQLHVSFLDEPPPSGAFASVDRDAFAPEDFAAAEREVYLYLPNGIGRTKLVQALGLTSRLTATTRNWRTVERLLGLTRGL